jgi:hypothetical protein
MNKDSARSPSDTNTTVSAKTWFDHMTGYLKWKVLGPDINNPYKTPLPYHSLNRMTIQQDYLAQYIQIRCMCDGYEVMVIANPANPRIISNHPCISTLDHTVIVDYIHRAGLDQFIESEMDRIRNEIKEHLGKRTKDREEPTHFLSDSTKQKDGITGRAKDATSRSRNFRIIKR